MAEERGQPDSPHIDAPWGRPMLNAVPRFAAAALAGALGALLVIIAVDLAGAPPRDLAGHVMARLDDSGVANPVTAVLLNFRVFDTWLELGALVLAMMGVVALFQQRWLGSAAVRTGTHPTLLAQLAGLFVCLIVLVAAYLLWLGTREPGGAFQAGAMLAGAAVLARLAGRDHMHRLPQPVLRVVMVLGFAMLLIAASVSATRGYGFFAYAPGEAAASIFALELGAAISIAACLWGLYIAGDEHGTRHDARA